MKRTRLGQRRIDAARAALARGVSMILKGNIRLSEFRFVEDALLCAFEVVDEATTQPPVDHPPPPVDTPPPPQTLPTGYDSDKNVGRAMLVDAMMRHNLTPRGVQRHGQQIVDALNQTYPGLNVWLSPSDAPVWPGFGSLDVTIDSGLGGWSFRPDGQTKYER